MFYPSLWTRRLAVWLIVCLGCAGLLPLAAAQPNGGVMDEVCSIVMGVDTASTQSDAGSTLGSHHSNCSVCSAAMAAPGPVQAPVPQPLVGDASVVYEAGPDQDAAFLATCQARAPPVLSA